MGIYTSLVWLSNIYEASRLTYNKKKSLLPNRGLNPFKWYIFFMFILTVTAIQKFQYCWLLFHSLFLFLQTCIHNWKLDIWYLYSFLLKVIFQNFRVLYSPYEYYGTSSEARLWMYNAIICLSIKWPHICFLERFLIFISYKVFFLVPSWGTQAFLFFFYSVGLTLGFSHQKINKYIKTNKNLIINMDIHSTEKHFSLGIKTHIIVSRWYIQETILFSPAQDTVLVWPFPWEAEWWLPDGQTGWTGEPSGSPACSSPNEPTSCLSSSW